METQAVPRGVVGLALVLLVGTARASRAQDEAIVFKTTSSHEALIAAMGAAAADLHTIGSVSSSGNRWPRP